MFVASYKSIRKVIAFNERKRRARAGLREAYGKTHEEVEEKEGEKRRSKRVQETHITRMCSKINAEDTSDMNCRAATEPEFSPTECVLNFWAQKPATKIRTKQ